MILAALIALLCVASLISMGNLWLPLMVGLGATIGIPMGLGYPFSFGIKAIMTLGLLISVLAIIFGFKNAKHVRGQASAVSGVILWVFIGLLGLGTGT